MSLLSVEMRGVGTSSPKLQPVLLARLMQALNGIEGTSVAWGSDGST